MALREELSYLPYNKSVSIDDQTRNLKVDRLIFSALLKKLPCRAVLETAKRKYEISDKGVHRSEEYVIVDSLKVKIRVYAPDEIPDSIFRSRISPCGLMTEICYQVYIHFW